MIVFHHIVRTGGEAVIANIMQCNPTIHAQRIDAPFMSDRIKPLSQSPAAFVHGHFAYSQIPAGCTRFTFARHPIIRFGSIFYSLREALEKFGVLDAGTLPVHPVTLGLAGGRTMAVPKEQRQCFDRIENFIDVFLASGGTFGIDLIPEIFQPDYTNQYDVIGITEEMGHSLIQLNKLIKTDWSKMTVINTSNRQPIKYRLSELRNFLQNEIEGYERAKENLTSRR